MQTVECVLLMCARQAWAGVDSAAPACHLQFGLTSSSHLVIEYIPNKAPL